MFPLDDTIAAIATPPRNGERGIVRLAGPNVIDCVRPWFDGDSEWSDCQRSQVFNGAVKLDDSRSMPCELYLWPHERSYTRQPSIELHTLGATPLLQRLLSNVCETGARLANPGEFTLRAFLSGRLDLAQAEAVLGVIDAEGEQQLAVALRQLSGGISQQMSELRGQLLDLCADLEAGLDFVEEDIEFVSKSEVIQRLDSAADVIGEMRRQMQHRTIGENPPKVVFWGLPNVGKSRLLNTLLGHPAAIVSSAAGTTRDYLSLTTTMQGITCELVDTAGLEATSCGSLALAQSMTAVAVEESQLRILCLDVSQRMETDEQAVLDRRDRTADIVIGTKGDLPKALDDDSVAKCDVITSSETGQGIEALRELIAQHLVTDAKYCGESVGATAVRCQQSIRACGEHLRDAARLAQVNAGDELVVADLRTALDYLGQVVGAVYTDDILDRVFSRFCIGK